MDSKYYASAETDTDTAAKKISDIIQSQQHCISNSGGVSGVWNRNLEIYYKNALCDVVNFTGQQGELVSMSVPQARSLTRQTVAIVCKQKLNFKAISRSVDYASMVSGQIAEAIANQVAKDQDLDSKKDFIAEQAYVTGQCFWHLEWDAEGGPSHKQPDGSSLQAGEVNISVTTAPYVYYDWNATSWKDLNWVAVAERKNRYDLMAKHPELEKEILQLPKFDRSNQNQSYTSPISYSDDSAHNDLVLVYKFYHKPTPAAPYGRLMILAGPKCVFYDGSNPYECIPVVEVMPERYSDVLLGYPQFSNLAPCQEMLDHNFSVIASNQTAYGVQSILNPRGSNINVTQIFGANWIDYTPQSIDGGGKPEALQLTRSAPELINMLPIYNSQMAELANINGALRGTPPPGITAGNALATLTANSIEFLSAFSHSIYKSIEEVATLSVKMYRMFGAENQIVTFADGNTSYAKEFKAADLNTFERITLDITNPAMATYGGRLNDAEQLLAKGLIPDIGTYYQVKEGAPVKAIYNIVLDETNLIQKENDDLMKGLECPVLITDNHQMHKPHHLAMLNNPELRRNGQFMQIILAHVEQHDMFEQQQMMQQMPQPPGEPQLPPGAGQGPSGPPTPGSPPEPQGVPPAQPAQAKVSF